MSSTGEWGVMIGIERCKGCGLCILNCPTKHLTLSSRLNKRGVFYAIVKKERACLGCGFCFLVCPETCIEVWEGNPSSPRGGKAAILGKIDPTLNHIPCTQGK